MSLLDAELAKREFQAAWDRMMDRLYEDLAKQCAERGWDPKWFRVKESWLDGDDNLKVLWEWDPDRVELAALQARDLTRA